ncbi:MAG: gamma-glutamyl-gamma-aminobutyrate hydrolase family protein [Rickettsiales bacterium]
MQRSGVDVYTYSIAAEILPHCRFSTVRDALTDECSVELLLPTLPEGHNKVFDAFFEDLAREFGCKAEIHESGQRIHYNAGKSHDSNNLAALVRYLAARYNCSAKQLIDQCPVEQRSTLTDLCHGDSFATALHIEDTPDEKDIILTLDACAQQSEFLEWLGKIYDYDQTEKDGKITLRLHHLRDTNAPMTEAQYLVDLSRNIAFSWGLDRGEILRCIHPPVARDYVNKAFALRAAPQIQSHLGDVQYSQDIAIVGGGFSGVSYAIQQINKLKENTAGAPIRIRMIERRPSQFAGGIAYGTAGYEHHVNVPAEFLSLDPHNPKDFVDWLEEIGLPRDAAHTPSYLHMPKEIIVPTQDLAREATQRRLYHYYLMNRLHEALQSVEADGLADVEIIYDELAKAPEDSAKGKRLTLASGRQIEATHAVFATGHGKSPAPKFLTDAKEKAPNAVILNQWGEMDQLTQILSDPTKKNVVVFGTGLSAMDVVMTADKVGFFNDPSRKLTLLSRSGNLHPVMDKHHDYRQPEAHLSEFGEVPTTIQGVDAYVTRAFDILRKKGFATINREHTNEEVFFALAPLIPEFVKESGLEERDLLPLLKQHSSFINTTAVPMAETIGNTFHKHLDAGQVVLATGDTAKIEMTDNRMQVQFKDGHALDCDALVSTLPPVSDPERIPLYKEMLGNGALRKEPRTNIGIDVDTPTMRAIKMDGTPDDHVFVIGPIVAGDVMADLGHIGPTSQVVSGLRQQASRVADCIDAQCKNTRRPTVAILMNSLPETQEAVICERWLHAVENYGLQPLLIKPGMEESALKRLLDRVDGVMLTGADSNHYPPNYGQEPLPDQTFDLARDQTATFAATYCKEHKIPIFGICRGAQDMNIALGGQLTQHIEGHDQGYQEGADRKAPAHAIQLREGGFLATLLGKHELQVNSIHRQGIKVPQLAEELEVEATAGDVVEAFGLPETEHPFFHGVQFHPEFTSLGQGYSSIFETFSNAVLARHAEPRSPSLPLVHLSRLETPSKANSANPVLWNC